MINQIKVYRGPILRLFLTFLFFIIPLSSVIADDEVEQTDGEELKAQIGRYGEDVGVDTESFEFSPAETRLWLENHLKNINKPTRLYYEFQKSGSFEEGFTDSVYLDVLEINKDGSRNANLKFFSNEREQRVASEDNLTNVTGNPVLGVYLQGDVYEMNRLTDGSWRYFQRRIKLAISETTEIEPVDFEFEGKSVQGEKIVLKPYTKDPKRERYEEFADKRYEFILSDQIPGTIYQIRTVVPDREHPDNGPLIEEVMTLRQINVHG